MINDSQCGSQTLDLGVAAAEASSLHGMFQLDWCLGCLYVFSWQGPSLLKNLP